MPPQTRLQGALTTTTAQGLLIMLGWVTHFWVARVLGQAAYGIFGVVLSVQTIVSLVLTLGVPMAVARFVARDEGHAQNILRSAVKIQVSLAVSIAAITALFSRAVARALNDVTLAPYLAFMALVILLQAAYPIFAQFLSGMHRFHRQAALTTLYAVAKLAGAIGLMYYFAVYGALAGFAVGGLVAAALGWWWTRSLGGRREKILPWRAFLQFAGTYVALLIGLQLLVSLDLFMVKTILASDRIAGLYSAAATVARIPYVLLQALMFVLLPSVSALTKPGASHDTAVAFIRDTFRYLIGLIVPGVALAATTSRGLISLFYSATFAEAAPVLTVLIIGVGSIAFYLLLATIVAGAGKTPFALVMTLALLAFSGGLGYFLIPRFGMSGAAWQTTASGLLGLTLIASYTVATFGIRFPLRSTLNIITASAIAVVPTYLVPTTALTIVPLYVVAGMLYGLTLFILGEITAADRARVAKLHPLLQWLAPA